MAFEILEKNKDIKYPSEWVNFPSGGKFNVNGVNHPEFQRAMEVINMDNIAEINDITLISKERMDRRESMFAQAIGLFLVSNWSDVALVDGAELEYNQKNVDLIFKQSKQSGELVAFVIKEATRIQNEAVKKLTETLGKSKSFTSTTKDTQDSQTTKKRRGKPSA